MANNLACRGLDHLEEKIPALQYPVDKVSHRWDSLGSPDPSAELTRCLWACFWMVMGCSGGKQCSTSKQGLLQGLLQPTGWLEPSQI